MARPDRQELVQPDESKEPERAGQQAGGRLQRLERLLQIHLPCHSNGTDKDITQSGLSASDIRKVPARAMKYAKKSSYKSWGFTKYKLCQVPAYFMQILAELTAANGLGNQVSAVLNYKLADRYEGARTKLVSAAAIGGIAHPHLCETYYLLTQHATASNFQ